MEIAILGLGAWGKALAIQAARNRSQKDGSVISSIKLWARKQSTVDQFIHDWDNKAHNGSSKGFCIDEDGCFDRLPKLENCQEVDLIIIAVPVIAVMDILAHLPKTKPVLLCAKGILAINLQTPYEAALQMGFNAAVLSGPNLAHEIIAGLPAASVIASKDLLVCQQFIDLLGSQQFRCYISKDPLGVSLCGAVKNVIAIAAAMTDGLQLGENAKSALITRSLAEIGRLLEAEGGCKQTVLGLAGIGDVMLTATSRLSRNYLFGYALGSGKTVHQAIASVDGTIEGVQTVAALIDRAERSRIDMPIMCQVGELIKGSISLQEATQQLLQRPVNCYE